MPAILKNQVIVVCIALLVALSFAAGEVMIFPEQCAAEAARKKRRSRRSKQKKDDQKKQQQDELDQALGKDKKEGKIDLETLKVKDDVKLTSAVGVKIDESIAKLMTILENFQEPGTLRRLAEFYWKKSHQLNLDKMREHQGKMDQWFEAGQKGDPPAEPDNEVWFRYNRKAVEVCEIIIDRYPQYQGMDEVYFFMGYNLNEIGRDADAVRFYKKLVREFPQSSFVADTWMAIGDYYFSHNNVYDAMPAYEEVLKYDSSKVFGYAKYKIGWCYFNLGKYVDAIETFKEVVAWSEEQTKGGKSQITLKEEALKDLVMAFAEEGNVEEAERYFMKIGGKKYFRMMLVRLADIYTNQGKFPGSIAIYKRLINDYPLHRDDADFQLKIVEAYSNLNDKENTTKEILNMVYYAKPAEESEWVKANQEKDAERIEEAWENAERMLIKTVVEYHKESLKINNQATWDKTQKLYEIYIQYFQKSKTYYNVCFNYAELLYRRDNYKMAGEWYTKVAEMDPKGKHFEEASYSAILSYEKLVHEEIKSWISDTKKRSKRKDKSYKLAQTKAEEEKESAQREQFSKRELSENVQGFVKACNIYIDNIPKSKYKVDIIYKVAIIYYAHNHFPEAVDRFQLIVKDYPTHRLAEYAANLVLDSLNIAQQWRKLNDTVRAYLKNKRLVRRAAFRRDLVALLEKSSFKKVEVTEKEKRWVVAAEEYLEFCKEFPRSKMRDKALYNASVHYVAAGELEKSIEVQKKFLKEEPKSPFAGDVLFKLGKNYEALAYYDQAADRYEEYQKKYPKGKDLSVAMYNAAIFHENLGHTQKAVDLKQKYAKLSKDEEEKDFIAFSIPFMYLDVDDDKNAEKQFKAYLKGRKGDITWPTFEKKTDKLLKRGKIKGDANRIYAAHIQLLEIYKRQKRQSDIDASYVTILKLGKCDTDKPVGEPAREAVAEASFVAIQPAFQKYAAYRLRVGRRMSKDKWNKRMGEILNEKSKMVLDLQKAYEEIIALKSPQWSVAALYQIGQIYKYYSLALFNSEVPYWLTMDQEVIYQDKLYQRAEPIEQKALEGYDKCLKTAYKTGVYNDYTIKARQELEGYVPDIYKPVNEIKFKPGFESDSLFGATFLLALDVPDVAPKRIRTAPQPGSEGQTDQNAEGSDSNSGEQATTVQ